MMCERILLWSLSSLLRQVRTVSYFVSCWVNIFSLANYTMLTSLDEYFWQQFSVAESCMHGSLFVTFLSMTISWRHISQGRISTRLRCGGILTVKEFWKSVKTGQLPPWVWWSSFLEHSVYMVSSRIWSVLWFWIFSCHAWNQVRSGASGEVCTALGTGLCAVPKMSTRRWVMHQPLPLQPEPRFKNGRQYKVVIRLNIGKSMRDGVGQQWGCANYRIGPKRPWLAIC